MIDVTAIGDQLIHVFRESLPWVGQAVKGAVAGQVIREGWQLVKNKLFSGGGKEAVEKVEAQPEKARNWEILKLQLLEAMEEDEKFRADMAKLAGTPEAQTAIQQSAVGNRNKQAGIVGSPGASIKQ
jgi:hypothetical protein